jgi:PAS domain S-box-containing protein
MPASPPDSDAGGRAPAHGREAERLTVLDRYRILDTPREPAFDDLASLAAEICEAPIAVVNLVALDRQWFKAEVGLGVRETPLDTSFCAHAILQDDFLQVPDATLDARFDCNPLVTGPPGLRFYAGTLLKSEEGLPIGTLCVLDTRPRQLAEWQVNALQRLGRQVMSQLELRLALRARTESEERLRFLDRLAAVTQPLTDPAAVMAETARLLGEHLAVVVCAYADMEPDQDGFTIRGDWTTPGAPSIVGFYSLRDFGATAVRELRAGRPLVTRDTLAELGPEGAALFLKLGLEATVCMPLVKEGRLTALMAVHADRLRDWTEAELGLIADTTERSWAHIERTRAEAVLREREERLRLVIEGARDYAIITTDPERRVTSWSIGAEAALGWTAPAIIGRLIDETFTPEDRAGGQPEREIAEAREHGRGKNQRWHMRADGSRVFMNGSIHPLPRDEGGSERGFLKVVRDETERRAVEARRQALIELSDRIRDLEHPADLSYAAAEILGTTLGISRVGYGTIDLSAETITIERDWNAPRIRSLAGVLHFRDYGSYIEDLKRGETVVFADAEADPRTAATAEALKAISAQSVVNMPVTERGGFVALLYLNHETAREWSADELAFVHDVVERTRTAVERRRAEGNLRELAASLERQVAERTRERDRIWMVSQDLLGVANVAGYFESVNPAWTTVLGWSAEEVRATPFLDLVHSDDREATKAELGRLAGGVRTLRFENCCRTRDGAYRWLSWTAVPEGDLIYVVARDVTEERSRAEALRTAEEALRQAQKMEAMGQLTGGVAHDFNNLLTIIKSSTDLLRRPDLSEERRRRYVDAISDTVGRASRLTSQLLAFARRQALKPEVFDAAERLTGITDMLRTIVGSRITITTDIACNLCLVEADASQFETAVVNMAVNARDAMDGAGALTMRVTKVPQMLPIRGHGASTAPFVAVSITDTGSGITKDRISQIFEPFFTTKEVGKGTGLGLSQVYGFAKQSGGDVQVSSQVGRGTTFTLYLPRAEQGAEPGDVSENARGPEPANPDQGRRVLVVEDNVEVGTFVTQLIADLGYETSWAANADEALELLRAQKRFDAVFSDVVMPGMNGVDLGREIRRRYPGLPVVLTSGYSHVLAEDGRHGFELLHKPYAAEQLARVLGRMMESRRSSLEA